VIPLESFHLEILLEVLRQSHNIVIHGNAIYKLVFTYSTLITVLPNEFKTLHT
jgi:hypothetical protein